MDPNTLAKFTVEEQLQMALDVILDLVKKNEELRSKLKLAESASYKQRVATQP